MGLVKAFSEIITPRVLFSSEEKNCGVGNGRNFIKQFTEARKMHNHDGLGRGGGEKGGGGVCKKNEILSEI